MGDPIRAYPHDVAAPLPTPSGEVRRILAEQAVELKWWGLRKKFADQTEVAQALEDGALVQVPDVGQGYKIEVKGVLPERRCLERTAAALLEEVASRWSAKVTERGIPNAKFLVVTSLTRPTDYQRKLQADGVYPAAEDSSHERGLAFDIAIKWFRQNVPGAVEALREILEELKSAGLINWIDETTVGCFHVSPSPQYAKKFLGRSAGEASDKAAE